MLRASLKAKEKAKEIVTIVKYTLSLLGQTVSVLRQTICPGLIMLKATPKPQHLQKHWAKPISLSYWRDQNPIGLSSFSSEFCSCAVPMAQ